jgi:arabinan endo-1,5-alpha-L-arabinosidase
MRTQAIYRTDWRLSFAPAFLLSILPFPALAQETTFGIHDPVMARQGDRYYVFGTGRGVTVASSIDRVNWEREPSVLEATPEWVLKILPDFGGRGSFWAPDIYHHDGTYYLYYSVSSFGRNNSAIGVATNRTLDSKSPDFKWVDRGMVVNSVAGRDMWNAIDAQVLHDEAGVPWMTFGSHWGGLKLFRLDASLTKLPDSPSQWEWHTIAARNRYWKLDDRDAGDSANPELDYDALYPAEIFQLNQASENGAIEAPFIFRKNGLYYLFASWDRCCRGANSTYKVVVGRSRDIRGPYVDREDERMDWGGGTLVVKNFEESPRWAAGGHNSVYTWDGKDYLVFHAYEHEGRGASRLVIKEIEWDPQGWPSVMLSE